MTVRKPEGYCGELSPTELAKSREVLVGVREKIDALLDEVARARVSPSEEESASAIEVDDVFGDWAEGV